MRRCGRVKVRGNDLLFGGDGMIDGEGSDTYMMTRGEGAEVITDVSASGSFDSDTLIFTKAVYSGDVWMARNGDDLLITINADGGSVLITGYFTTTEGKRLNVIRPTM